MVTVKWTPQAIEDLYAIFEYIAKDSKSIAKAFVEKLYKHSDQLITLPA